MIDPSPQDRRSGNVSKSPSSEPSLPELLKVAEVAKITQRSLAQVYADAANGDLPSYRLGTSVRIDRADLMQYLSTRRVGGAQ